MENLAWLLPYKGLAVLLVLAMFLVLDRLGAVR